MSVQEKLIKASHMISMDDIVREGNETLRTVADEVSLPLSDEDIILGEKMMEFLRNSQNPAMAEKMQLRPGVGLAANQLDIAKKIIAVLIPNDPEVDENGNEVAPKEAYKLAEIMYNAKIVSHSVQDAAIESGEGCLSVDREVPGLVIRHARVTVE
ncbi:MAG: peptide deformylase, partial [Lactococcus sp.]